MLAKIGCLKEAIFEQSLHLTCCYLVIFVQKPPIIHVIIHMGVLKNNSEMY